MASSGSISASAQPPAVPAEIGGLALERIRALLCALQDRVRDRLIAARRRGARLTGVAGITTADTIYRIDRIGEAAILRWFGRHWPRTCPVELVMEGLVAGRPATFPRGTPPARTLAKCIIDPVDGTRTLMHDKRAGWMLAAVAPQRGPATGLADLAVAAMTELPVRRQTAAEQWSAIRGRGPAGVIGRSIDLRTGRRARLAARPSRARDCRHGFASLTKFFPEGKALTATIEEALWRALRPAGRGRWPVVFDDQYLTTGGQLRELLTGRDRMIGDLRPLVFRRLGLPGALVCHPYDICTALIFSEAGGIIEAPLGGPLDVPLDTVTPVAWVGYANSTLARLIRPALRRLIRRHLGRQKIH